MEENHFYEEFETRSCSIRRNIRTVKSTYDSRKHEMVNKRNNAIHKNADALPLVKFPKNSPQKTHFILSTIITFKIHHSYLLHCTALGSSLPMMPLKKSDLTLNSITENLTY
jgi:hypothetical protein